MAKIKDIGIARLKDQIIKGFCIIARKSGY
jgi:hypothetical protein